MNLTTHAIERYQQRIRPDLSLEQAEESLKGIVGNAKRIRGNTKTGALRYDAAECMLIVKQTKDAGLMVVSIYPLHGRDPSTVLKWDGTLSNAAVELNALIDKVCGRVEASGDVVASNPVERAPASKKKPVVEMWAVCEGALERVERALDRVKEAEKNMRAQVNDVTLQLNASKKREEKARNHAILKQRQHDEIRAFAMDLIRAMPEDTAREIAERHGDEPKWVFSKAMKESS